MELVEICYQVALCRTHREVYSGQVLIVLKTSSLFEQT